MSAEKIEMMYVGLRISAKKKLLHYWVNEKLNKRWGLDKPVAFARIGDIFEFQTLGESIYLQGEKGPKKICSTEENIDQYIAADAVAKFDKANLKMLAKWKKEKTAFEEACEPLKRLVDACRINEERACLINAIVAELWRR